MAILPDMTQMTREQLLAQIEALRAQAERKLTIKVSEKGAVAIYGLGRFPVTLYSTQMSRLLDAAPLIRTFMRDNADKLAQKP